MGLEPDVGGEAQRGDGPRVLFVPRAVAYPRPFVLLATLSFSAEDCLDTSWYFAWNTPGVYDTVRDDGVMRGLLSAKQVATLPCCCLYSFIAVCCGDTAASGKHRRAVFLLRVFLIITSVLPLVYLGVLCLLPPLCVPPSVLPWHGTRTSICWVFTYIASISPSRLTRG